MALQHEPNRIGSRQEPRASAKETAFRTHLAVYVGVGLFLFTLNLLTSPFDLWFYWPLFFWGWALALHAFTTYGADAPARIPDVLQSLAPWMGEAKAAVQTRPSPDSGSAPFAAEAFAAVHERIERIKAIAWRIVDDEVRRQATAFCDEAERIVAALARDRAAAAAVRRFDAQALRPAESLLEQYAEAARHGAAVSQETARRIAERDLPLILGRIGAFSIVAPPSPPVDTRG